MPLPFSPIRSLSRREALRSAGIGFGSLALAALAFCATPAHAAGPAPR